MTPLEIVSTVRTLLDSGHEWYAPLDFMEQQIDNAQRVLLAKAHAKGDERCLRPLYVFEEDRIIDNTTAEFQLNTLMFFPRNLIVKTVDNNGNNKFVTLSYLEPAKFENYNMIFTNQPYLLPGANYPKYGYWSYVNRTDANNILRTIIQIKNNTGMQNLLASILYIRYPVVFSVANNIGLEVPLEYHFEVACFAAERINTMDVTEQQRGLYVPIESGQRVPLQNAGGVND